MSMRRSALAAVFVSVLFWLCPADALAQSRATSADLTGTVKDDSQTVVPGARVAAVNLETRIEIRRDRTFFFGSFERLDVAANNFVTIDEHAAGILRSARFPIVTGHVPYQVKSNAAVFKIDHNIRSGRMLTVRYNFAGGYNGNTETWGGLVAESRGGSTPKRISAEMTSVSPYVLKTRFTNSRRSNVTSPAWYRW